MGDRLERGKVFAKEDGRLAIAFWRRMGGRFLTFVGGEPTLHPALPQFVEAATDVGFEKVMIDTNALLPERITRIPASQLFYVRVSLDGASDATHDRVRGSGNFKKAIAGIERLVGAGYSVRITSTVFPFNTHEIPALVEIAEQFGIRVINLHSFTPEGLGAAHPDWVMKPNEWVSFWKSLQDLNQSSPVEVRYPPTWASPADVDGFVARGFRGCLGCSLDRISVFPDGRCYVCSMLFDHEVHFGTMTSGGFELNTQSENNEFELFARAAIGTDRPELSGCPSEKLMGIAPDPSSGLVSVCRLWRTSVGAR
jgi:sulfatase maturation enzyme AslB (radical SAM superfamily)